MQAKSKKKKSQFGGTHGLMYARTQQATGVKVLRLAIQPRSYKRPRQGSHTRLWMQLHSEVKSDEAEPKLSRTLSWLT
jgi:hypothetical protein